MIEDLDVSSMLQNTRLSRRIADGGWYEFRRQLAYKAELRGNKIFVADRWYASTKKCSRCQTEKEMALSERCYKCNHCGLELDRDLNAAINLKNLISNTVSSTEIYACGQNGSVVMLKTIQQPVWQKQELSRV